MEPSNHGPLPPLNNFSKCSSNSNISAPLEGEDKEMGGAAMQAVATSAEEAEDHSKTRHAGSNTHKVSRGREDNQQATNLNSSNIKVMVMSTTMEDADKDSNNSEEEEQGACAHCPQTSPTAGATVTP